MDGEKANRQIQVREECLLSTMQWALLGDVAQKAAHDGRDGEWVKVAEFLVKIYARRAGVIKNKIRG